MCAELHEQCRTYVLEQHKRPKKERSSNPLYLDQVPAGARQSART